MKQNIDALTGEKLSDKKQKNIALFLHQASKKVNQGNSKALCPETLNAFSLKFKFRSSGGKNKETFWRLNAQTVCTPFYPVKALLKDKNDSYIGL